VLLLTDVLPTAFMAAQHCNIQPGDIVAVWGCGPVGLLTQRCAVLLGAERVIAIDHVPDRLRLAGAGDERIEVLDCGRRGDVVAALRELTGGRGPDSVLDAVGMEAHGAPVGAFAQKITGLLPDKVAQKVMETGGIDRMVVLHTAIDVVRRGGTLSISGVYGGTADPMPMLQMFDKQLTLRMGQANVKRWIGDLMPLLEGDDDPLDVDGLATHRLPLEDGPKAYETFQKKEDDMIKTILQPHGPA
jgi:threonine dehydrogenase-like Zn-dependent dehydrogenase